MVDQPRRGKLKIFLGFAAGVGKTYQMLEEAQALKSAGADVVVGYFEPHARKDTIALVEGLEMTPRKISEYRGKVMEEMDVDAIQERHPAVCVVDEFPHTNVPGSRRAKRWEDVMDLLDSGMDVLTTMNIQHLESLNDQVFRISGVRVRETIPDWVMEQASEVVMVDLTPRALLHRLERGVVYSPEKARQALTNFFQESTLVALREMALRQTAHEVGMRQADEDTARAATSPNPDHHAAPLSDQRILVLVTADPSSAALIRRAKRVSDFIAADCVAVAVVHPAKTNRQSGNSRNPDSGRREKMERHLNFARNLHVDTRLIEGDSVPAALVQFARTHNITQIFMNWPKRNPWRPPFLRNDVQKIVSLASDMELTIVDDRKRAGGI